MLDALDARVQHVDLVDAVLDFVMDFDIDDMPDEAVEMAQYFLMDTIAVGVAGKTYDATDKALAAAETWGEQGTTRVVGRPGIQLARTSAAFMNGMQIHALEWDGLHDPSVVIAMCVPVSAMMAELDHRKVSGKALLAAFVIAIEVGVFFGGATDVGPRFFRPAVTGLMGASMAMARLRGFNREQTMNTLGIAYSQASGTMQAHWEGSMVLPMQIGVAARAAHMAADLAAAGMTGPKDIINGKFGFFRLFEDGGDISQLVASLARPLKVTEMSHKPYPAGRATQATLTMIRELNDKHVFQASDIESIEVDVPPLVMLLVGRPASVDMSPSYARLCLRFVAPLMLVDGDVDPRRFITTAFSDPAITALAEKMTINLDDNPDQNALGPQKMRIKLYDGTLLTAQCSEPLGSLENPLSRTQRNDKVRRCFELGLPGADAQPLIDACDDLLALDDARVLLDVVA
ncbi:MAG: MmgE/PrpD family protein [Woeseiaceae bacterium]